MNLLLADQARLTAGASMWTTAAVPEAGIPSLTLSDGPMGIASGRVDERDVALLSPCATLLGASFDVDLARRIGSLVGGEAVARGVDMVLAPNVNLARSPLAGRAFEYFSEDPLLVGTLGAAWVQGLQSTGTGACPKHMACNDSETDRDHMNAVVDERTLREVYLLPFELCAAAGAGAMLTAYNRLNGTYCAEQSHVTTIVKQEWGFDGPLISDWFGTHDTLGSLNGGLDLEMPGPARFMGAHTLAAVENGDAKAERLADAAQRVAHAARRFGAEKTPPTLDTEKVLIEAAAAGMVLLKNEGDLLPLAPGGKIALIGPNAANPCYQGGTFAKIALSPEAIRPLEALRRACPGLVYEPGVDPQPRLPAMPVSPISGEAARGMTVEYFAGSDMSQPPISSETRDTNSLVWFVGVHDQGVFDAPAAIRASGWFTPETTGEHRFYAGATGMVRLCVNGETLIDKREKMAARDVMGSLKRGDAESATLHLEAGAKALVEVEFHYDGARVHGLWYGVRGPDSAQAMLERAVQAAREADTVILMVGETSDSSVESKDRPDTRLPEDQIRLIEAVCAANPRTAIVANVGHAFDVTWSAQADALLLAWYPGEGFGPAVADVLTGTREPGGRLPVTLARQDSDYPALDLTPDADGNLPYAEGTAIGYRGLAAKGIDALYAFGEGQGHTRFAWLSATPAEGGVTVRLRNEGDRPGSEVVQLYRHAPELALIGFAKAHLAPGEEADLFVPIEPRMLRIWQDGWQQLEGDIQVSVARSSRDIAFSITL
ncbi:beta-glucosidase [Novosphingobium terrae]|uniref:beta-glucosidase n=1 Tax=Novosphingobium terrae TaxID=2726189 RepID=UPI00197F04C7|nr:glycoside hydrolase family 3 C-terminal domain-containing protein [Novosphingobium terrae]